MPCPVPYDSAEGDLNGRPRDRSLRRLEITRQRELLTAGALRFVEIDVDGDDIYWVESRPDERGRYAVMRRSADGETTEATGPEHSARTLVHEYGGGALAVHEGVIYFSNFSDQRIYRQAADAPGTAAPITPPIDMRYADAVIDAARGRLICVAEDHRQEEGGGGGEPARLGAARRQHRRTGRTGAAAARL